MGDFAVDAVVNIENLSKAGIQELFSDSSSFQDCSTVKSAKCSEGADLVRIPDTEELDGA